MPKVGQSQKTGFPSGQEVEQWFQVYVFACCFSKFCNCFKQYSFLDQHFYLTLKFSLLFFLKLNKERKLNKKPTTLTLPNLIHESPPALPSAFAFDHSSLSPQLEASMTSFREMMFFSVSQDKKWQSFHQVLETG